MVRLFTLCSIIGSFLLVAFGAAQSWDAEITSAIAHLKSDMSPKSTLAFYQVAANDWPLVQQRYEQSDGFMRSRILYAAHTPPGRRSPLLDLAVKEKSGELRRMGSLYILAVGEEANVSWKRELVQPLMHDPSPRVRLALAENVFRSYGVTDLEARFLSDHDAEVRRAAAMVLGASQDPRALPGLLEAFKREAIESRNERPISQLEITLSRYEDRAVPRIEPLLRSRWARLRSAALRVLTWANAPRLLEYGRRSYRDKDADVRQHAVEAMAWTMDRTAIPLLIKALADYSPKVRAMAAERLEYGRHPHSGSIWPEGKAALRNHRARMLSAR